MNRLMVVGLAGFGSLVLGGCAGGGSLGNAAGVDELRESSLTTIAFGSCAREDRPQPIWDSIVASDPELFLFIGDNMYADIPEVPDSPAVIQTAYENLAAMEGYQNLIAQCPVMPTWDDHDFGKNDAGKEWGLKADAQRLFLDFYGFPEDAAIRDQEGIYHSAMFGPKGKRVQVIMLDTRYNRDPLYRLEGWRYSAGEPGPYRPIDEGTILGEDQWAWLGGELKKDADVRIIASSIQVVASEHGWETWGNMPHERQRLFDLIDSTGAEGAFFVSGDRHLIEMSRDDEVGPYPMWDFTSSGFNWGENNPVIEDNSYRVGEVLRQPNYGVIKIDWEGGEIVWEGRSDEGDLLMEQRITIADLAD